MKFRLGVLPDATSLEDAFAYLYEARQSAVAVVTQGGVRLVGYEQLMEALARGATRLGEVDGLFLARRGTRSLGAESFSPRGFEAAPAAGSVELGDGTAEVESNNPLVMEYAAPSTAARCDRPNKPAGTPNKNWYHYYPPNTSAAALPHPCSSPGCTGTVR